MMNDKDITVNEYIDSAFQALGMWIKHTWLWIMADNSHQFTRLVKALQLTSQEAANDTMDAFQCPEYTTNK